MKKGSDLWIMLAFVMGIPAVIGMLFALCGGHVAPTRLAVAVLLPGFLLLAPQLVSFRMAKRH